MQIDLPALAKRAGTYRRGAFIARAIEPTSAQASTLLRIYMRVVRGWQERWRDAIRPEYERALSELITDDAATLNTTMGVSERQMRQLAEAAGLSIDEWVAATETWHRGRFAQAFNPTGVKIGALLDRGDVAPTLAAVLGENVALIRSLDDQMRNGISGAVFRGLQARTPARDVAKEIQRIAGVGQSRAELIAADQLQKLTGALDEQRQKQVGIAKFKWSHSRKKTPRPEHVARDGKVYAWTDPVAKTDPPGRAIRCGCRALAVLEIDDDVETTSAPEPAAPPPPPPRGFRSPINPATTAESITVAKRLAVQKELRAEFAAAAQHPKYDPRHEFRDRQEKDFGNATFAAAFDDETVSMLAALKPELDDLADQIGIPRLRGFKSVSGGKAVANQGDGVMGLNPAYFNAYAERVGGREAGDAGAALQAQRDALRAEMQPIADEIRVLLPQIESMVFGSVEREAANETLSNLYRRLSKLRDKDNALWRKQNALKSKSADADVSTWKPGDDPKARPFTIDKYFADGIDKARTTLFHEFGHHVHQYLKREGYRRQFGPPPLERDLSRWYRREVGVDPNRVLSKYATTNPHEWFAESFSAYVMGRKDLLGPSALELIEAIFNGTY